MEKLAQLQVIDISQVIAPTLAIIFPLLEEKRKMIEEIPRNTFKYGSTDRHQLDVYYPITHDGSGKTQVLVWVYGGGFSAGNRRLAAPLDLAYTCVGAFPAPAEDVRDAILWTIKHPEHLITDNSPNPDTKGLFVMGHSAGAAHIFTALVLPETTESKILRSSISGVVLCAGPFQFLLIELDDPLLETAKQYWEEAEGAKHNDPMGLLHRLPESIVMSLPRIALVVAEHEPKWLLKTNDNFGQVLESRIRGSVAKVTAKGHNHVSTNIVLGIGEGEEWAEEVIAWIKNG